MRLFIASSFEPRFGETLRAVRDYARANSGEDSVKWVEDGQFHITYAFLGDLPEAKTAVKSMDEALQGLKAFTVVSGGLGAFPSSRNPRVLWLSIAEGDRFLREINEKLAAALAANGLVSENRFEPHVTLGRVKRPLPENFFRRAADYAAAKRTPSAVRSVELMRSVLTPEGPEYSVVYTKRLL